MEYIISWTLLPQPKLPFCHLIILSHPSAKNYISKSTIEKYSKIVNFLLEKWNIFQLKN